MFVCKFTRAFCFGGLRSSYILERRTLVHCSKQPFSALLVRPLGVPSSCLNGSMYRQCASLGTSCCHQQISRGGSSGGAPTDELVVYTGPLSRQVRGVKLFSLVTSMAGVFAQPAILERAHQLGATTGAIIGLCSVVGFFTFVTPLLLHWVTKKYVTSVVYNVSTNSYTATTYSLFVREKMHTFRPGEAIVPDVQGFFTSVTIRGTPLFLDARFFEDLTHYEKIMGYDKPMDFKLKRGTISPMDHVTSKEK